MNDVVLLYAVMNSKRSQHETTHWAAVSWQNTLTFALSISSSQPFNTSLTIFATETHDRVDCPYQDDARPDWTVPKATKSYARYSFADVVEHHIAFVTRL